MKKLISSLLCAVLLFTMAPGASASVAKKSTDEPSQLMKAILTALDQEKIEYELEEREKDEDEHLTLYYESEELDSFYGFDIDLFVNEEYNRVQLLLFYLLEYDEKMDSKEYTQMLEDINQANLDYNYVKLYSDKEYSSIDAEFSCYVTPTTAGKIAMQMIDTISLVCDAAYTETLYVYDKEA